MNATQTTSSILPHEAAHFGALAAEWWDPKGSSAMLHRLNPVRLGYIRRQIDAHWRLEPKDRTPVAGRRALDVGCGAGLLAEPLARLGAATSGIDAAPENITVARDHAAGQGLKIDYRAGGIEGLDQESFDLVTAMEVIEHVADPTAFVASLALALAPGGLLILSTPNRTPQSRLALITIGEGLNLIPRGTHDWDRFLTPDELTGLLEGAGLAVHDVTGLSLVPGRGFGLSGDVTLNYLLTARHAG